MSGLAPTLVPTFYALGAPIRMMLDSQAGSPFYGNMLETQGHRLNPDPETVHGVADGLMKAATFVLLNPDAALKTFLKVVPEIDQASKGAEQTRLGIGLFQVAMLEIDIARQALVTSPCSPTATLPDLTTVVVDERLHDAHHV